MLYFETIGIIVPMNISTFSILNERIRIFLQITHDMSFLTIAFVGIMNNQHPAGNLSS